jgi:CheY-like chemotaxis protein
LLPRIRPAKERHPDLILSETSPPNGGGFQFLRDIRALGPENGGSVPVIAMTAFAQISKPAQRKNGRLRKEEALRAVVYGNVHRNEAYAIVLKLARSIDRMLEILLETVLRGPLAVISVTLSASLQQSVKFFAHNTVTLAGNRFQAFTIEDCDPATRIFY